MHKRSFGTRVYIIADKYGIEQVQVHEIISSYIAMCRELLFKGYTVSFFNLVSLVPDYQVSDYSMTLAYQCKLLSQRLNRGYHTVFAIIKEYLDFLREDLLDGNDVTIRGLVTLHPIISNDKVVKVHSAISVSIKRDLFTENGQVTSVRAHTYKLLRYSIRLNSTSPEEVLTYDR